MADQDCGTWVLKEASLRRYNGNGALTTRIGLPASDDDSDGRHHLAVDPYDNSVWIVHANKLVHRSSTGIVLSSTVLNAPIRSMVVANDQSVWLLGNSRLFHYSTQGSLIGSSNLSSFSGDSNDDDGASRKKLVIDNISGLAWIAIDGKVILLKLDQLDQIKNRIPTGEEEVSIVLDPFASQVWIAAGSTLRSYDISGTLIKSINLATAGLGIAIDVAFDPTDKSIWVLTENKVGQFATDGVLLAKYAAGDGENGIIVSRAMASPALVITPVITLIAPPHEALSNDAWRNVVIGYDAQCNGQSCGFGSAYLEKYTLNATINNQAVGGSFVFDPSSNQAKYVPLGRHAEGVNTLTAQAKDESGRFSNAISSSFTIDTVAPKFLTVTPAEGSVVTTADIVVQGTVDDPTAIVMLDSVGQATNPTVSNSTLVFSSPVRLMPGANALKLTAIDRAGNVTSNLVNVTLKVNTTPGLIITAPTNGSSVNDNVVVVSGTFSGPSNAGIQVNGVPAAQAAGNFYATVPLQSGANTIAATIATAAGETTTSTLEIISTGMSPITVTAYPSYGVAPQAVTFDANSNTQSTIVKVDVDFDGNGSVDLTTSDLNAVKFTYLTAGVYQARIKVTTSDGNAYEKSMPVVINDAAQIEKLLIAQWSELNTALIQGSKEQALNYLNPSARAKYGPVFDALMPQMPAIVGSYSSLQKVSIGRDMGEFAVNRMIEGVNYIFFVYFLLGEDGIWRLSSM